MISARPVRKTHSQSIHFCYPHFAGYLPGIIPDQSLYPAGFNRHGPAGGIKGLSVISSSSTLLEERFRRSAQEHECINLCMAKTVKMVQLLWGCGGYVGKI